MEKKEQELVRKVIRYSVLFVAVLYVLIALSQLFALPTGGYSFDLSDNEEEFYLSRTFSEEVETISVNVETADNILHIMNKSQMLEHDWIKSAFLSSFLVLCFILINKSGIPIISDLKINIPFFVLALVIVAIVQWNYFAGEIQELKHLLIQLQEITR